MILVCGKNGQLGRALAQSLSPLDSLEIWGREDADFGVKGWEKKLKTFNPESVKAVVNAAAFTKVDLAEEEKEEADKLNHRLPKLLAEYCAKTGAFFVHFSTDYVFDGKKEGPYAEEDEAHPLNVYGKTKLLGDKAVMGTKNLRHLIFRTSWVYGLVGKNFPHAVLRLAAKEESLSMDASQTGAPTSAEFLAGVTALVLRDVLKGNLVPSGLYNLAASGETTWLAFARHLVNKAHSLGFSLSLKSGDIAGREEPYTARPARRPLNSRLSTVKFQKDFGIVPPHFIYHADLFLDNLKAIRDQFE